MSSDRPIFVVGCPRSGTTMLSLMIHAHPRLAMPPESRFLLKAWRSPGSSSATSRRREQRLALAKACVRTGSKVRDLGLDPQETLDAILAAPPTLGSAFGTVFKMFADKHGKPPAGATSGRRTTPRSTSCSGCSRTRRSCTSCGTAGPTWRR